MYMWNGFAHFGIIDINDPIQSMTVTNDQSFNQKKKEKTANFQATAK